MFYPNLRIARMTSNASDYRPALTLTLDKALAFLDGLENRPMDATVDVETLRNRLSRNLADRGIPSAQVIDELTTDVAGALLGMPSGRFFGWVIGGATPAALAADWLTSTWDQNAALYVCSPAAAMIEEIVGEWLKDLLDLPSTASFALVTGCQMAHATCLAAARHALLAARGWNVEARGLYGAPRFRIVTTSDRHVSLDRAARLLGLGAENIISHDAERGSMDASALERALQGDASAPTIVLMQAGDINTGAFDAFETLIPVAKRFKAWVHVDGGFGLWTAASPNFRHLVKGCNMADSWAADGHKWLNVPFDCGYAFVADSLAHRSAMSIQAPYIAQSSVARDEIDWNPEWSRRARGFSTYAAIRELGRQGIADLIERTCRHASAIVNGLAELPGVEVLAAPIINQGLVRFLDGSPQATAADHDRRTERVINAIVASGEAFFGATSWRGRRAMRVGVLNWQTSERDVERAVAAVAHALSLPLTRKPPVVGSAGRLPSSE